MPTGNILIVEGDKGYLECLSLGDYGKNVNIKADFLGLSRIIKQVRHTKMLPLSDKWVVTISTQYGCAMGCTFCDVPKVGKGANATYNDLISQILTSLSLHPEVKQTNRLNIHYARMGEPTWNWSVIDLTESIQDDLRYYINDSLIHPVVSTMLPKNNKSLEKFLNRWMEIKNALYGGDAGLQLSINSTSNEERDIMFNNNALSIESVAALAKKLDDPIGRKITLNFAIAGYEIDAVKLRDLFDPKKYIIKLTPMHKTASAIEHCIQTPGDYTSFYPYISIEQELKDVGFDVLVFIASEYEDLGRITCGNAILSGLMPGCDFNER